MYTSLYLWNKTALYISSIFMIAFAFLLSEWELEFNITFVPKYLPISLQTTNYFHDNKKTMYIKRTHLKNNIFYIAHIEIIFFKKVSKLLNIFYYLYFNEMTSTKISIYDAHYCFLIIICGPNCFWIKKNLKHNNGWCLTFFEH